MGGVIRGGVLAGLVAALVTVAVPVSAVLAGRTPAGPASWMIQHVPDPTVAGGAADRGLVCLGQRVHRCGVLRERAGHRDAG